MSKGRCRNRALIEATLLDDTAQMRRLLAEGAIPDARDPEHGETALMLCRSEDAARLLLDAGADVNARDGTGRTPFMATGLSLLLDRGADINASDVEGTTALIRVVQSADLDLVQYLLRVPMREWRTSLAG